MMEVAEQKIMSYKEQVRQMRNIMKRTKISVVDVAEENKDLNLYTLRRIFQSDSRYYSSNDFDKRFVNLRAALIELLKKRAKESIDFATALEESANPLGLS